MQTPNLSKPESPAVPPFNLSDIRLQALLTVIGASFFLAISPISFIILLLAAFVFFSSRMSEIFHDTPATAMGLSNEKLFRYDLADGIAGLTVVLMGVSLLTTGPLPSGDMLRHLSAWSWHMDVTRHYAHHEFPHTWSWWWGWDNVLGWITQVCDGDLLRASRVARTAMLLAVGSCLWLGFSRAGGKNRELAAVCFAYTMVFLVWGRIVEGKPDLIMLCGIGLAAYCTNRWVWVVLMIALIPSHWMSGVLACAAFMLRSRSKEDYVANAGAGMILLAASVAFWCAMFGREYLEVPAYMLKWIDSGSNRVSELISAGFALMHPLRLAAVVFCTMAIVHAKEKFAQSVKMRWEIICWLVCPFLLALPDITAYAASISAVLALIGLRLYALVPIKMEIRTISLYASFMLAAYGMFQASAFNIPSALNPKSLGDLPELAMPQPRVLASYSPAQHFAAARWPQAVITPIFEVGAVDADALAVVRKLNKGSADCANIQGNYDYVLEDTLHGAAPGCLRLVFMSEQFKLWAVAPAGGTAER